MNVWRGYFYAIALFLVSIFQILLQTHYYHIMNRIGLEIRTALVLVIYKKVCEIRSYRIYFRRCYRNSKAFPLIQLPLFSVVVGRISRGIFFAICMESKFLNFTTGLAGSLCYKPRVLYPFSSRDYQKYSFLEFKDDSRGFAQTLVDSRFELTRILPVYFYLNKYLRCIQY